MDISTGEMVAGLISLVLTIFFFVALARIEAATRKTAELAGAMLSELQSINARTAAAERNGIKVRGED